LFKLPIDGGIGPVNEFVLRTKDVNAVSAPIVDGILPFNEFEFKPSEPKRLKDM